MVLGRQQITTETAVTHSSFLGNHIKKKKKKPWKKDKKLSNWAKHWSIYTGRCDGTTCLPDECFKSLPAPAPATSSSAAVEFYTPSLSTPPTAVPWTPFPHSFPLLRCFICAFPFLPLSTYPPPFKKRWKWLKNNDVMSSLDTSLCGWMDSITK